MVGKNSMALRTASSLKSDKIGQSILRASTVFSEWSLNFLTTSSSLSLASKIWFDSFTNFNIIGYSLHIETIAENLLRIASKLNTKISLSFIGKKTTHTIIFPIFIKKTSPNHNWFSVMFILVYSLHLICFCFIGHEY